MNIQFSEVERKGVKLTEVSFNGRMVYIVKPGPEDPEYAVVDPHVLKFSKSFTTFDDASAFAAAYITGSYYED